MRLETILEAILMAAEVPLNVRDLLKVLADDAITQAEVEISLGQLQKSLEGRGIELVEVASGWRLQVPAIYGKWVGKLFETKAERYSKALYETLALIAYQQPLTRGDIEMVRGVAVSSNIMRILEERQWIEVVGRKEIPGRPMIYATTTQFLDDFNLKSLSDLPELTELSVLEKEPMQLGVEFPE